MTSTEKLRAAAATGQIDTGSQERRKHWKYDTRARLETVTRAIETL